MKSPFKIRFPFTITIKLLLFVIPIVCIPIAIVGYLSYKASVESVTHLSREEQILRARAAAAEINTIFESCLRDLETMVEFIVRDLQYKIALPSKADEETVREKMMRLFRDFGARSPYYIQIRLLNSRGQEVFTPRLEGLDKYTSWQSPETTFWGSIGNGSKGNYISRVIYSELHQRFIVQFSRPLPYSVNGRPVYKLVIDLDFDKVIELVNAIRIGKDGYAFLVDRSGRTIAHPLYKPYEYDLTKYEDPRFREFIVDIITSDSGWRTYYDFGEKAAAFAPVPATGWSLAVSIPIEEFKREANIIRSRVFALVLVILIVAGFGVSILSYQLLKPVRELVVATERIAGGNLRQEIPVTSRDELGTLTRSFNRMVRNLRKIQTELIHSEKLISMGRLSAGLAHEIRNPLNAIKGAIVYLQKGRSDDPLIHEYTQLILEEINRLNEFMTDFLYFARQSPPNRIPIDLNELLQHTLNLLDEEFKSKGIAVSLHVESSLPLLEIDPHQMEQVFLNLFFNAAHAMPNGGKLEVTTSLLKHVRKSSTSVKAVVEVKDNGIGIPPEHLKNIFDPFFSTKEGGTGLGLPISLGIVESHGGKIQVMSKEGKGTSVIIELPMEGYHPDRKIKDAKKNTGR
ncbi:MAG: HAMP domain-containing protein [Deltaproteobacteria bacterium]|nr:HAMP domain-containing protein [Deltaproteobacteria bacterium]